MVDENEKEVWEQYPEIWKTKSEFFTWLRGALRREVWSKYPPKLVFKNKNCTKPPEEYKGKAKSGAYCSLTKNWVNKSNLEVDHIKGNVSLRDWEDLLPFVRHLCASEDNMQLVSKEAHKIKSYAEKQNISFEHAELEKYLISLIDKEPRTDIQLFLSDYGYPDVKVKDIRDKLRDVFIEYCYKGEMI